MNKWLSRFLAEFKRRKVGRVISVYAAAAFVILELTSIVAPSLGMPEWTTRLVIILLSLGFVVAAVLSWIFDRHPGGGLVRTIPEETKSSGQPGTTEGENIGEGENKGEGTITAYRWKLATYFSLVVILILVFYHVFTVRSPGARDAKNTIAVLPFHNDSPDRDKDYIVNGLLEAILNNLAMVEDMHVVSRTSIEQYRGSSKGIREIGQELNVNYILEGSATILENRTRIYLQLIEVSSDRHLWSSPFQREITLENLFDVQTEVALAVTGEMKAILTPEEKAGIEKKPSENLAATNLYLRARNLMNIAESRQDAFPEEISQARDLLEDAIRLDPEFTDALAWLGTIYINNLYLHNSYSDIELSYACLDSGIVFIEKALALDNHHAVALYAQASYYQRMGMHDKAQPILEQLYRKQHKTWLFYQDAIYRNLEFEDYYGCIESYFRYLELRPADVVTPYRTLNSLHIAFRNTGYYELSERFLVEILSFSKDTLTYLKSMTNLNNWKGDYPQAIAFGLKRWERDSSDIGAAYTLLNNYLYLEDTINMIKFLHYIEDMWARQGLKISEIPPSSVLGSVYQLMENNSLAERHFKGGEADLMKHLQLNTPEAQKYQTHLLLALHYSIRGEDEKALEYLAYLKQRKDMDQGYVNDLKNWPHIRSIRNTPEFQEILAYLEGLCLAEYERIGELLQRYNHLLPD